MATLAGPATAQEVPHADIVTMRNGDIHDGTVAQEVFTLETPYGDVAVDYGRVARLVIGRGRGAPVRIVTRAGERFSGRLRETRLTVLRLTDPTLRLHTADIADIEFAPRRLRTSAAAAPDAVEMRNGDAFVARLETGDLMVKADDGLRLMSRADIHILDVVADDDGTVRGQALLNTPGGRVQGTLLTGTVSLRLSDGARLEAPAAEVATLAIDVIRPDMAVADALRFPFRARVAPASLFRDRLRDGSPGPPMVVVRGGRFRRGDGHGDGDADERPARDITLARPFAIGLYEVTFEDYDAFCQSTRRARPDDQGWGRGRRPVINVSWEDAQAYVAWLGDQTGERYRLPTDAEWEYAARGGTGTRFWWGDEVGAGHANCAQCGSLWDGEKTARVGKFPPNPFGLHDTAGNVFEWVADCWHDAFAEAPADGSALEKAQGCGKRVIRGGAWSFPPAEMRSANRWRDFPSRHSDDTGFRVARDL